MRLIQFFEQQQELPLGGGRGVRPSLETIMKLRPLLARAAQGVYDQWEQDTKGYDECLGTGGICQDVADAMSSVIIDYGIEAATIHAQIGDQHVWVIAKLEDGVYEVDIPPCVYEIGSCYTWRKIADVKFDKDDIVINKLSADPNEFEEYMEI